MGNGCSSSKLGSSLQVQYPWTSNQDMGSESPAKKLGNLTQAEYYWRSDQDPFSDEKNAKWEAYVEKDNIAFEGAYQKYLTQKGPPYINLLNKPYRIDFLTWRQISLKDSKLQRPIKRILNEKKNFNVKKYYKVKPAYFWRSDTDPFSSLENATWRPYDEEDNCILEEGYQKYLLNSENDFELALKKASNYKVNFKLWRQSSLINASLQIPFKREEIIDQDIPEFFWRSDKDPYSSEEKASWSPYDYGDSLYLEKSYQMFINEGGPAVIDLGSKSKYSIDFKNWIQFQKSKPNKQRPIIRGNSEKIKFIVRKDRWDGGKLNLKDNYFNKGKTISHNSIRNLNLVEALKSKDKDKNKNYLETKKNFNSKNNTFFTFLWEI